MLVHDPHRFVNDLDETALDLLIKRLESRAQNPVFAQLLDKYTTSLIAEKPEKVLEFGCGTGAVLRALARRGDFTGHATGVDHCAAFINAANQFSKQENVAERLSFKLGDVHELDIPSASFDVVIAHTLLSHVTEPAKVLSEMARVVRPNGKIIIFDGDYTSLTYAYPDHGFGQKMDAALANTTFNNPRIMHDLPRLLPVFGLRMAEAWGDAVVEIGEGNFYKTFAEAYVPYVKKAGILTTQAIDIWLNEQYKAMEKGTFFAACNYYTYFIECARDRPTNITRLK